MKPNHEALAFRGTWRQWCAIALALLCPVLMLIAYEAVTWLVGNGARLGPFVTGIVYVVSALCAIEIVALFVWLGSDGSISWAHGHKEVPWLVLPLLFVLPMIESSWLAALYTALLFGFWYVGRWVLGLRKSQRSVPTDDA